ncbi:MULTISPECIES: non-ribosomal peptide synthetase [unclassified Lysobacter]|uniref:non-ribosomal peptide synthetase n=1 Tax=unclassified Lysobacter TaxID=2635362 RepID=UPI001BE5AF79|nr:MULTISPECIES: non-ribosomal peptide synthetase [unclassified Lysobacter]MBT2748499.1 amino acid adenylation domain-containing protein [Lysobacter sp. ISL-42]MBT2753628.1 amino acid adenylation domain-containing protein [Lysobacter sp. ISL-50]MBT2779137.1 amino acid adenylation domain-containing protein [Lysobacter sp. ISL-54]MBT2784434.1 amino acid adenylation domain-containing protein [Lysobacter sp. ISL-52]
MTPQDVLARLRESNISVHASAGELVVRAARGVMTAELLALLKEHKAALLATLPDEAAAARITPEMLPLVQLSQEEIDGIVDSVPGGVANIQDIYPLAPLQEGILFHHLLDGEADAYLLRSLIAFDSRARLDAFVDAMQKVIARHDILRSAVRWQGVAKPVQVVHRQAALPVNELACEAGEDAMQHLLAQTDPRRTRLDLRRAPLLEAFVVADPANGEWLLSLLRHHMVCDHVTMELLLSEVAAVLRGDERNLSAPQPYRNFIARTQAVSTDHHEAYFREHLGDIDTPTAPFDVLEVQGSGDAVEESKRVFSQATATELRASARRLGVSPAALFHLAWGRVLAQCSGREAVVFGTVLSGRLQATDSGQVVGMFINTLPIRIDLDQTPAIEAVRATQRDLAELLQHEQASLALAQRSSGVQAPLPLFTTLLNYRHSHAPKQPSDAAASDVWTGVRLIGGEERTNYPVTMAVEDWGDGFGLTAQCAAGIDPERMAGYLETAVESLLQALREEPQRAVRSLKAMPDSERQQVLEAFNATGMDFDLDQTIQGLFEAQVARREDSIALEFEGDQLSYGELNRRANRLAHHLIQAGMRPDARVAIHIERSVEMVVGLLAILKSGGAYVPLDPSYPSERLNYMLADCAPVALLTQRSLRDRLPESDARPVWCLDTDAGLWADQSDANPDAVALKLTSRHLAYVIYTSGSTGQPKGAMNEHRGVVNRLLWAQSQFQLTASDRVLQKTPFGFDVSVWEFFLPLLAGARLVMARPLGHQEPDYLASIIDSAAITVVHFVPSMLQVFLEQIAAAECGSLRQVLCSGEALPYALQQRCLQKLPSASLHNLYGPTEAAVDVTYWRCDPQQHAGRVPIGRPIANTRMYVLDAQSEPAPVGVAGELFIGGVQVGRGYLNRPELTAERFVRDPFNADPRARMYKTGDMGRWLADGTIEYLGRNDFQVKIRGFRIELGEIEARLMACEGVREAVVISREDVPGDKRLVAYAVMEAGVELSVSVLRESLSRDLAEYMVPSAFVALESLPLTPNGKLDRKALPAPDRDSVLSRAFEEPVGEIEIAIAAVWQDLLGLEQVGRNDHFFELGGHSLLVIGLIERLRQRGYSTDVRTVFTAPVLRALAEQLAGGPVASADEVAANPITPETKRITPDLLPLVALSQDEIDGIVDSVPGGVRNLQDIYPLAPLQEGILFHHLLEHGSEGDAYLMRSVVAFDGRERLDTFLAALQQVIARHDILRTSVHWEGLSRPVQVVHREAPLPIEALALDQSRDVLPQLLERTDPRRIRFDLRRAPLLRAYIAEDRGNGEWLLALLNHHMVDDNYSLQLLLKEVQMLLRGEQDQLAPAMPYRSFIARTNAMDMSGHEAYFTEQLSTVDEPTAPFGILNVQGDGEQVSEARIGLAPSLAAGIRDASRRCGVSPAVLFHVAWAQVVAQCSGREDVVFGTVLSGRLQGSEGADQVVGMFINTLPVRLSLADIDASQAVRQMHQRLVELLQYEQASLALAQRCSAVQPPLPLFTALMNYRHSNALTSDEEIEAAARAWNGMRSISVEARNNYPLTMSVEDLGEAFGLTALTVAGIDAQRLVRYMEQALASLLSALEGGSSQALKSLSILPSPEREAILHGFNSTEASSQNQTLVDLFAAQVARTPDAPAVSYEGVTLSYAELDWRANQVAHRLIGLGVKPDDRVAICVERSVEMVVGLIGILKAGAGYVPLDPSYPLDRLSYMLADSAPMALATQASVRPLLGSLSVPMVELEDATLLQESEQAPLVALNPTHLAYMIYTSGSTGQPKGVMIEHRSPVNFWRAMKATTHREVAPGSRIGLNAAYAFDMSLKGLLQLLSGHCVLPIPQSIRASGPAMLEFIEAQKIDALDSTPSQLEGLLAAGLLEGEGHRPVSVLLGGEPIGPKLWAQLRDSKRIHFHNMYGPTECTVDATIGSIREASGGPVIGRPIANTPVYVLDARGEPVPVGVVGELHLGGVQVARGYWNRPGLTAERFVRDPFSADPQARMYKTGDLGRWLADGTIEYLGRNDFQVKIRGFRIELGEIEARLVACDGVREAVVIAREDVKGDKRLVAYVVMEPDVELSVVFLRDALSKDLAEYMVPSAFVALESLPLTPNGKLDRKALPAPDQGAVLSRAFEAPQGEIEIAIAEVWQDLLGLERVGRNDHFFELGGHSLLVIGLIERLRQRGFSTDVRTVFTTPMLRALAEQLVGEPVATAAEAAANPITRQTTHLTPDLLPLVTLNQNEIDGIVDSVPGGVSNIQDIYPLAPLQEGILFHHLLEQDREGDAYLMRSVVAFDSRERLDLFLTALQQVIERHDILRSSVRWQGLPRPVQVVHRDAPLPIESIAVDPQQAALPQLLERTDPRRMRLDLSQAPVLRGYIAQDATSGEWLLALLRHHLVCDHVAMDLILSEIQTLLSGGTLPAARAYRHFIAQMQTVADDEHEAYFRAQLASVEEPTAPFGILNVQNDGEQVEEARLPLSMAMAHSIRDASRRRGVTPAVLFHVAWARVLGQCSGREDDVVFGTVLSGRLQGSEGADQVVGMFLNTLPIRIGLDRDVPASIAQVYAQLSELLEHEQASLALAQRCSGVQAPLPLFTSLLNYRHGHAATPEDSAQAMQAWSGMRLIGGDTRNNYPLTMSVEDLGEAFGLTVLAVAGIDPQRLVRYMEQALASLLLALEDGSKQALQSLPVLPEAERETVLREFNLADAKQHDQTLVELFAAQVARTPDAPAVSYEGATLSYAELDRRANQVAHRLIGLGVKPDDRVAICVERSVEMVVGLVGILKAGGGYVPLDPSYPLDRLSYMLTDSAPMALVTQASVRPLLGSLSVPVIELGGATAAQESEQTPLVALNSTHLAYMIYTSGSTGQPKGVMIEHRSPVNFWRAMQATTHREVAPGSRIGLNAAYAFDMSLKGLLQLLSGHCVLPIPQSIRASGPAMLEFIEAQKIDALDSTPSQLEGLLAAGLLEGEGHRPISVLLGGEPIGPKLWAQLRDSKRIHFHNMYGPTECTVDATIGSIREATGGPVIGRPIANTPVYVLDARGEPVPIGVVGELHLGGVQVARGYWNRPELTAERFVRDPFSADPQARMYKTGDLGRWLPDGTIEYLGRNDFQVKIRGFRIELGEIEARLVACDGVREAVVIAREDVEGDKRLVAYAVMEPGAELSVAALRDALSKDLAEYMVPSAFVALEALPLTPNGKLDRKALPAPDQTAVLSREYAAPQGEIETAIAEIWQDLLGIERVGRYDHFFELGGHSLLAMQLMVRVREQFHVDVPLRGLFEQPVLHVLADAVRVQQMMEFLGDELQEMEDELDGLSEEELLEILKRESVNE